MLPTGGWLTAEQTTNADVMAAPLPVEFSAYFFKESYDFTTLLEIPISIISHGVRARIEALVGRSPGDFNNGWAFAFHITNTYSAILLDYILFPVIPNYDPCVEAFVLSDIDSGELVQVEATLGSDVIYAEEASQTIELIDNENFHSL